MRPRVLLTGFGPFGPHRANPSEALVRRIAADPPPGIDLATLVLPVSWDGAFPPVAAALAELRPDAVLHVGLAANRTSVEFERFAVNWRSAPLADETGRSLAGVPVEPGGPAAVASTADVDALAAAAAAAGAPAAASSHAGTFLCNDTLYRTLRWFERRRIPASVAFCHLPPVADATDGGEAGIPGLDPALADAAVRAALLALVAPSEPGRPAGRYAPSSERVPGELA